MQEGGVKVCDQARAFIFHRPQHLLNTMKRCIFSALDRFWYYNSTPAQPFLLALRCLLHEDKLLKALDFAS